MKSEAKHVHIDPETLEKAISEAFPEMYSKRGVPNWVALSMQQHVQRDFDESIKRLRSARDYCMARAAHWFPVSFIRWEGYASPGNDTIYDEEDEPHRLDADGYLVTRGIDRVLLRDQGSDLAVEVLIHREADAQDVIALLERILADIRSETQAQPAPEPERAERAPRRLGPIGAWHAQSKLDVPF